MAHKAFITNAKNTKTLKKRLHQLIEHSKELKFLVGFFYFSGWQELYKSLKECNDLKIKVLVGLQADQLLGGLVEVADQENDFTTEEKVEQFFSSMYRALNAEEVDVQEFYEQVDFFIDLIDQDRLIIRKTYDPNHAKLYIFKFKDELHGISDTRFITGSSNLTRAGILERNEFNVEIGDYGTAEADAYFDELWESAIPITDHIQRKSDLINMIRNKTQAATVTPFEAYVHILKTYIETQEQKQLKPHVLRLLDKKGYETYVYQLDAVNQALTVLESYDGVIIADVVGLGKSIIASMIAKNTGKRGMIICPPGLIGDRNAKSGWKKYMHDFQLYDWEIRSTGDLEKASEYLSLHGDDIEVVLVDEVHRFRNQDTESYEQLSNICRNRKVVLLTATPFNNSPVDIFSLLKLFIIPGKSKITLDDNLEARFASYNYLFRRLSFIAKNHNSSDLTKRNRAERFYEDVFKDSPIDITKVKQRSHQLATEIRAVLEPVMIRRNRLDLKEDPVYKKEVTQLSEFDDTPKELFFVLNTQQSLFYDSVINEYFAEDSGFTGAIYQPFIYEKKRETDKLDEAGNRAFQQQRNLYGFMRRLLVKRFESSFGAFKRTIDTFVWVHQCVLKFIENSGGRYILDRKLVEKIYENDSDEIEVALEEFARQLEEKKAPKNNRVYNVNKFQFKNKFLSAIESDLDLLRSIREEIKELKLVDSDPKTEKVISEIKSILEEKPQNNDPIRKVIIFTEYVDTVKYLTPHLEEAFPSKVFYVDGVLSSKKAEALLDDFDASVKISRQQDHFHILLTSDKLSEGVNLNRAGAVINYDIPWNPTRVIQRVGRINRIGKKVFEKLRIYNFFPTEQGADIVKSRQIAGQKMFLIHNTLGEDAKIFEIDETPTASALYTRINRNPEEMEDESLLTKIRKSYFEITKNHPEVISRASHFPARVKTAKSYDSNQLSLFRRKSLGFFIQNIENTHAEKLQISNLLFEDTIPLIECAFEEPRLSPSSQFWVCYKAMKKHAETFRTSKSDISLEVKALNNLQSALRFYKTELGEYIPFIHSLITDLRDYKTLPKFSLRRIASTDLIPNKPKALAEFIKELHKLRITLGDDYLEIIKNKVGSTKSEIIIALENISN